MVHFGWKTRRLQAYRSFPQINLQLPEAETILRLSSLARPFLQIGELIFSHFTDRSAELAANACLGRN